MSAQGRSVTNGGTGGRACLVPPPLTNTIPNGQLSLEAKEKGTVFLCFDESEVHPSGLCEMNEQNFPGLTVPAAGPLGEALVFIYFCSVLFLFQFSCSSPRRAWGRCT